MDLLKFLTLSWEQRKWSDTIDISTEMVDPTSGEYDDMPHIAPGNIESFTGRILDNVKLVKEEELISGKFRFRPGDVVYGKINPQLGKYFYASVDGLTSADAYVFNGKNGVTQKFLFSLLQTEDFFKYSVSVSKRSGMPKINRDELNAYSFLAPKKEEQERIGDFLLDIDRLITLHQSKLFEHNKKRACQFMISWEQRKAVDIADYSKGNGYSKSDLTENGTPIILYGRLYTKYQFAIDEVDTFATPKDGSIYSQGNEVIIPASGETAEDIARASAVEKSGILLGGDLNILRPFNFINPLFLALTISNGEPQKELAKKAQGKSVVHIHNSDIQEVTVSFPIRAEQDRIVAVFRSLDNLITLHQSKCYGRLRHAFLNTTISWEQRKVGDITIESTEYTTLDAGYPLLTSSRAGLMYQNEYRGNLTTDSKETLFSVVPIGACTYRHMSDDDVFHLNINTLEKGLVSREYPVFFATKENCLNFIIQYINSSASFRAFCAEQKKGGTRTRLYYNALCEFKMMVPSKREQEVIAGYLLSLDHLITLHQKQWFILKKLQFSPGSNSPVAA